MTSEKDKTQINIIYIILNGTKKLRIVLQKEKLYAIIKYTFIMGYSGIKFK